MTNDREFGLAVHAIARSADELAANLRHFANLFGVPNDDKEVVLAEEEDEMADGKKRKRVLKIVDPLAPERAQSAYNHFIKENYTAVKEKFQGDNRELMTELGVMWKKISPEKKKKFEELAVVDKKRFEVEQKKFEAYRAKNPFDPETEGVTMNSKKQKKKLAGTSATNTIHGLNKKKGDDSDDDSSSSSDSSSDSDELDSDEEESTPVKKPASGASASKTGAAKNKNAAVNKKKPLSEKQPKGTSTDANQDKKKKKKITKHKKPVTTGAQ
ncbi:hypothetical protein BDA99DRAFT_609382 [Phascolomyces articulosus]|uniref:HMG box domain-containing protein n=1 Tax=Phascolomyces articulosus TaxID=60185 RepID=A0AAD5JPB9_9FUNG|nr:hypothetical protein BDA99DRAFT_609382 [Phascolomyces articulosus]